MKFDLGFGNSHCVREAFINWRSQVYINDSVIDGMDYPAYGGDEKLVELTKEIIARQTGHSYKHVILTNGATGGVALSLRMYNQMEQYSYCITRNAPFYLRYPEIIAVSGMIQKQEKEFPHDLGRSVTLVDIPSNPLSKFSSVSGNILGPIILDGVYFNRVYMSLTRHVAVAHDIMVGSYSKLLGINGIRVGWAATNDDKIASQLLVMARAEYCGLSAASTTLIKQSLRNFDWENFEGNARSNLDKNRTNWSKVERFFGDSTVNGNGMFFYGPIDAACRKLLEKSEIKWTTGSSLGTDDSFGRFNLGQNCFVIEDAVKAILWNDKLK